MRTVRNRQPLPVVALKCPSCGNPMEPSVALEQWERLRQVECLHCRIVWNVTTTPDNIAAKRWIATLQKHDGEYPFSIGGRPLPF
jgi:uncharacterized Zn finger protein